MAKMEELFGAIAGLFLLYGINPEGTAGKTIIGFLKQIEKEMVELKKDIKNTNYLYNKASERNAELNEEVRLLQTENLKLKRKITLVTKYLNENIKLRNHTYGMDYTVKSRPLVQVKKILEA